MLPVGTRLDISLKKNDDLQICTLPTCRGILGDGIYTCIRKKIFSNRKSFFSNLQNSKTNLYLEIRKKLLPVGIFFFFRIPLPRNTATGRSYAKLKIMGHGIFLKRDIQPRGSISAKDMKSTVYCSESDPRARLPRAEPEQCQPRLARGRLRLSRGLHISSMPIHTLFGVVY